MCETRLEHTMLNDIIDIDMMFYTFDDFIKIRDYIKEKLKIKDRQYIFIYRMYVEARPWIRDYYKGLIWDYLNDYMTDIELIEEYNKYLKKYGDKNE